MGWPNPDVSDAVREKNSARRPPRRGAMARGAGDLRGCGGPRTAGWGIYDDMTNALTGDTSLVDGSESIVG